MNSSIRCPSLATVHQAPCLTWLQAVTGILRRRTGQAVCACKAHASSSQPRTRDSLQQRYCMRFSPDYSFQGRAQSSLRAWAEGPRGHADAAEGRKPVDDDGSHPTLLHLKRRNRSDEPMTAGSAGHSLRSRFDFSWAARPCYSLYLRTGLDWTTASIRRPEAPACERPHAGGGSRLVDTDRPNQLGAGRIAAVPFSSGARLDLSRPSATVSFL